MKYRYPGPKPFTEEDEELFFGRKEEKGQLNTIVQNNKLTVLFGRSGYGKSSLIQAGVVTHFKKFANYKVVEIRFSYSSTKKEEISHLRKQLLDEFKKHIRQNIFLSELENNKQSRSLWQLFTTIQWEAKQEGFNGILLIMDQFEEIFNFPKNHYDSLSIELADLVYNRIPPYFQETLMAKLEDADFFERNKEQIDFIKDCLPTSFLIGIRSDRLYLLDELGEVIPVIFNNRYKLKQLLTEQIEDIIEGPARAEGDFLSLPFHYSPEVIKKISGFFENKEDLPSQQKTIEAFELQIICKYIEEKVILQSAEKRSSIDISSIVVDNSYLPKNLDEIIKNYYIDIVSGNSDITKDLSEFERLIIRYLIEEKLIDNKTNSRICLDKVSITPLGFNEDLLDKLTETRIIRRELNTVTGQSYEISHDTLLEPIHDAIRSSELIELKHALSSYYHNTLRKAKQKSYSLRWRGIEKKFIDNHNNASYFTNNDFVHSQKNDTLVTELEKSKILSTSGENQKKFILNEAFQDVVSSRIKSFDFSRLRAALYALLILIIVTAFVGFLCWSIYGLYKREKIQRFAEKIIPESNNYQIGKENLLVLNYAYKQLKGYNERTITSITENLVKQFNYLYLYADTIVGNTARDSISRFVVLPNDRIIALFKSKNLNLDDQPERAILYDKNLHIIDSFPKIYDAQFLPGSNEMVILSEDSIRLYDAGVAVRLDVSNTWKRFKPLFLIQKNFLVGIAQTSLIKDSSKSVLINLNNGIIKDLSNNQNDEIFLKQDNSGLIVAGNPNIISVDTAGNRIQIGKYIDYFRPTTYLHSANGIISNTLNIDGSANYVDYSGYSGMQNNETNTLKLLSWNKSLSKNHVSLPFPILISQEFSDKFLITVSLDSIRIFDNKLILRSSLTTPKLNGSASTHFTSITSNKNLSKFLLLANDSSLYFITKNTLYKTIHTPGIISSAQFSEDEKIIFCAEAPIPGQEPGILILDSGLKIVGKIFGVELDPKHVGNLIVFKNRGKLLSIAPQKIISQFNNTNATVLSKWITSHVGTANPDSLKTYGISGGDLRQTFSSLINHKF